MWTASTIKDRKKDKLAAQWNRVPGEISKRSRDLRGERWSWTLKIAQKRSWVGRWSWAEQDGPQFCFELSKLFGVNSSATDIVFVTLSKHSSWNSNCVVHNEGDPLPLPFWRRSTVSPVFFAAGFPRSSLHSVVPFRATLSPSLISHLASVDVKQ